MGFHEVDNVYIKGPLVFREANEGNPITLPGDGILEIINGDGSCIVLANGSVLKGIRFLFVGDPPRAIAGELDDDDRAMLILCAEDGGVAFIVHESLDVVEPTERISVSDGANTVVDNKHVQIFNQRIPALGNSRRWRINDWAGV